MDTKTFSLVLSAWFVSYGSGIYRLKKSCQKNLNGIRNREILSKILQSKNIHPTRSVYWRIQLYLWKFISKKFENGIKTNAKVNKFASHTSKRVEILKAKNTLKYELFFLTRILITQNSEILSQRPTNTKSRNISAKRLSLSTNTKFSSRNFENGIKNFNHKTLHKTESKCFRKRFIIKKYRSLSHNHLVSKTSKTELRTWISNHLIMWN